MICFVFNFSYAAVPALSLSNAASAQAVGRCSTAAARTHRSFFHFVTVGVGIGAVVTAVAAATIVALVAVIVAVAMAVVAAVAKAKDIAFVA